MSLKEDRHLSHVHATFFYGNKKWSIEDREYK